jgi:hypothetical protein
MLYMLAETALGSYYVVQYDTAWFPPMLLTELHAKRHTRGLAAKVGCAEAVEGLPELALVEAFARLLLGDCGEQVLC